LLTLTGAPGTGKTRLALALAGDETVSTEFSDGKSFISLAPLHRAEDVLPTVARAFGVRVLGRRSVVEVLESALRSRRVLLVLDNCEHLLAAAPLIVDLLRACKALTVLATSRAPLHVTGEHLFRVPPLELPQISPLPALDVLKQVPSVQLFVQRASGVQPEFRLTADNAPAVAELCVRLDGLPLVIELAAARSALLEPAELLTRLDRRLPLLSHGPRDLPVRQRALRRAIGWSYDLLSAEDQRLFRRLGVFAGGCSLEAARAVVSDADEPPLDLLDGFARLLDANLVRKEAASPGRGLRVGMLETMREFALEQLSTSAELEAAQRRHAEYFVAEAERVANPRLDGPDGPALATAAERDHDNLRAALGWLLGCGDVERSVRLAGALWSFWEYRGHWNEGLAWIDAALAQVQAASTGARARALLGAASLHSGLSDYAAAVPLARESAAIRGALGDRAGQAEALMMLGGMLAVSGDGAEATSLASESLALREALGDTVGMAWSLSLVGSIALFRADFQTARAHYEAVIDLRRDKPRNVLDGLVLRALGAISRGAGDLKTARSLLEQALAMLRQHGEQGRGTAWTLLSLGELLVRQGEAAAGREMLEESLTMHSRHGETLGMAICTLVLGRSLPGGLLTDVDGPPLAAYWHSAFGQRMPAPVAQLVAPTMDPDDKPGSPLRIAGRREDAPLSRREQEVTRLIARGYRDRQVAEALHISERTAETYVARILNKLGLSSRTQLAVWATQHQLGG
jgi:predicted ATPase/DNA-binding CsgD family transcriptional regulator